MAPAETRRRLIVNADDFGRSREINEAVACAHQKGILTSASLMAGGEAFDEAVAFAQRNPKLGVGLHLTFVCGRPVLPPAQIPNLVQPNGRFDDHPVRAGWRYFFERPWRAQLAREMMAQFDKFAGTGLVLDHVNGHLHMHLHPVIFQLLLDQAAHWKVQRVRLTRTPFLLDARLGRGRWFYRLSHALIFGWLSARAESQLRARGIRSADRVFGLLETERVIEGYLLKLLPRLPAGDSELYSHPSVTQAQGELDALLSPAVRDLLDRQKIELVRYQDL